MTRQIVLTLVGYFLFSAGAGAMSPPTEQQSRGFYGWFYRFIQRLAANADRLAEARYGALAGQPVAPQGGTAVILATSTRTTEQTTSVAATGSDQ